jgi:transposase
MKYEIWHMAENKLQQKIAKVFGNWYTIYRWISQTDKSRVLAGLSESSEKNE